MIRISFFMALLGFCLPSFSINFSTLPPPKYSSYTKGLPLPDIKFWDDAPRENWLEVGHNNKFFEKAHASKKSLSTSTGFSPGKKNTAYSLQSPIKKKTKFQVSEKNRVKKKLFAEPPSSISTTVFTPYHSNITDFSTGAWAYTNVWHPSDTISFDSNHALWEVWISKVVKVLPFESHERFIEAVIVKIHEYLEEIGPIFKFMKEKLVCRHFSTMALPVFSKIFRHPDSLFMGTIRQISALIFDPGWKQASGAHAWNLVGFKGTDANPERFFLVDVFNKYYINLSKSEDINELEICSLNINSESLHEFPCQALEASSLEYEYTRLTMEKFEIGFGKKVVSMYRDEDVREQVARKVASMFSYPSETSVLINLDD